MAEENEILERIDLRALAEEAGAVFGPGNSSVCPLHAGADNPSAFHLYTDRGGQQRWHCFTRCPQGANDGDALTFYMRWRQVDFGTAVRELARRAGLEVGGPTSPPRSGGASDSPPTLPGPPGARWQARAQAFVRYAQAQLWSPGGLAVLDYLREERGLHEETLRAWGLGYNPHDVWHAAEAWGLQGRGRVWCPRGVVLPVVRDGPLWYVKVRRPLPGDALSRVMGAVGRLPKAKFSTLQGGRATLFGADRLSGKPVLLLAEGEFDALLAWQAAHDLCDVASLGGAGRRLHALDMASLLGAHVVLAIYDADQAGAHGRAYLRSLSERVVPVQPPAHDLTAYWQAGGNLRAWIAALVAQHMERLLDRLDEHRYAELFVSWPGIYDQALAVQDAQEAERFSPFRAPDPPATPSQGRDR